MYSYDKRAAAAKQTTYEESLAEVQLTFAGLVGEGVYDYVTTLHKRIGKRSPWKDVPFFENWDYGQVHKGTHGIHTIRVYQKSTTIYPRDIEPIIEIRVEFSAGVGVVANSGSNRIFVKRLGLDVSPSQVALQIGAGWEKLLTGSVDYGD